MLYPTKDYVVIEREEKQATSNLVAPSVQPVISGKIVGSVDEHFSEGDIVYFNGYDMEIDGKFLVKISNIVAYERD